MVFSINTLISYMEKQGIASLKASRPPMLSTFSLQQDQFDDQVPR
jgi:hypothetical protein